MLLCPLISLTLVSARLILVFFSTMLKWVLKKCGCAIPWACGHYCKIQRRWGDHNGWSFQSVWKSWCSQAAQQPQPSCLGVQTVDPRCRAGLQGTYTHMYMCMHSHTHTCMYSWSCRCSHAEQDWAFHLLQRIPGPHKIGCFQVCWNPAEVKDVIHTAD